MSSECLLSEAFEMYARAEEGFGPLKTFLPFSSLKREYILSLRADPTLWVFKPTYFRNKINAVVCYLIALS